MTVITLRTGCFLAVVSFRLVALHVTALLVVSPTLTIALGPDRYIPVRWQKFSAGFGRASSDGKAVEWMEHVTDEQYGR